MLDTRSWIPASRNISVNLRHATRKVRQSPPLRPIISSTRLNCTDGIPGAAFIVILKIMFRHYISMTGIPGQGQFFCRPADQPSMPKNTSWGPVESFLRVRLRILGNRGRLKMRDNNQKLPEGRQARVVLIARSNDGLPKIRTERANGLQPVHRPRHNF